jgi:trimeric autotransporter adhesin
MVKDITPGSSSTPLDGLTSFNGQLFFSNGASLWKSNGTTTGTVLVREFNAIYPRSDAHGIFTIATGKLFFRASVAGTQGVWKSDGTTAGTSLVKGVSSAGNFTNVNGALYFTGLDYEDGNELWKTDGTEQGTVLVKDVRTGAESGTPLSLTNVNGTLYFLTNTLHYSYEDHFELWKSDGTEAGTQLVRDFYALGNSYFNRPKGLIEINGSLFLFADDGIHGIEPWVIWC